jgi:UDP-glucose 4-epimerase
MQLRDGASVTGFGTDYDTPDGTCMRDYIHVTDLARAHVKAIEALERGTSSRAYNLGIGQGFSVGQVIETAREATGLEIPAVVGARRAGDPAVLISDAAKARAELGWQPRITDLARIVGTAMAWHQKHTPAHIERPPQQAAAVRT